MYCDVNFRHKVHLKRALLRGETVHLYQPGPFGGVVPSNGTVSIEGPWYPDPHTWYARVVVKDGVIVKVS